MRIKLPKGVQIEIEPFAAVAIVVTLLSLVVYNVSFALGGDVNTSFVSCGSSSMVASLTGYVIFRLTGGSLKAAATGTRRVVGVYFWGGAAALGIAITNTAIDQGGLAAFHLAANSVAPGVVVSLVLGLAYLYLGTAPD